MSEKLNCWPGCLAMIVKTAPNYSHHLGRVVTVVKRCAVHENSWDVDPPLIGLRGFEASIKDYDLHPLRDDEGEDEMLRIAGLPNKETTPAAH